MGKDKSSKQSAANKRAHQSSAAQSVAPATPNWPPFKPPLPVTDLMLTSPAQGFENTIAVIHNFWPKSLCRDYVTFLKTLPLTTTPGRPKRGEAVRQNDRYQVNDPAFSQKLWLETGLKDALRDDSVRHLCTASYSSNIRMRLMDKPLDDDSQLVTLPSATEPSGTVTAKTTWTLLLYLTSGAEGCIGGETAFYPHDRKSEKEAIVIAPETGMLLLHKHGDDCLLHEGREVKAGEKWILRSDLLVPK
ncbi:hypothetical protein DL769_006936 [Monosporascus sp. CRB-8-3]|nr:hypothetical protein DL769_006936 [Monosporascus sp. CRB-8-3]